MAFSDIEWRLAVLPSKACDKELPKNALLQLGENNFEQCVPIQS